MLNGFLKSGSRADTLVYPDIRRIRICGRSARIFLGQRQPAHFCAIIIPIEGANRPGGAFTAS